MWIELFLNMFNHEAGTVVHIRGELSTLICELSTKFEDECSFFVQVVFNLYMEIFARKFIRNLTNLQSEIMRSIISDWR